MNLSNSHAMTAQIQTWAEKRHANFQLINRLNECTADEFAVLEEWVDTLDPSANTLRELLRLADEIAARDERPCFEILSERRLQQIFSAEGLSKKEKQRQLRQELEAMRYPVRQRIVDRLLLLQGQILRDSGVKVDLPDDLEGDSITFSFKARSPEQVERVAQKLALSAAGDDLKEIFAVLLGKVEDL